MITWNKKYDYKDPKRVDGPDGRKYSVNGEKLPSVTTILGKTRTPEKEESLARWRQKVGEIEADKIRDNAAARGTICLLYTSPSPRDGLLSRMPSSA